MASGIAMLGGCATFAPPYLKPLSAQTQALLAQKGMDEEAPILIQIFKEEHQLLVWKQKDDGRFHLLKTYHICKFSGHLGPKQHEGDRQSPEGFYEVTQRQMNPHSREYLAFNVGYPNAYDRSLGRTGSDIMVHGGCRSIGCFAMTDGEVQEIFVLAREAFAGGQHAFQIQSYPFRMTAANMAKHRNSKWYPFWKNLKQGYDYFETTHLQPKIAICQHTYLINTAFLSPDADPSAGARCPAYRELAVIPYNQPLVAGNSRPDAMADAGIQTGSIKGPKPKPLGEVLGLVFGPRKPSYHMFTLGPATRGLPGDDDAKQAQATASATADAGTQQASSQ